MGVLQYNIPNDSICPGCKLKQTGFRKTPFGDVICIACWEADAKVNPDIYGDPLASAEIWRKVKESFRQRKLITGVPDCECTICSRKPSDRNKEIPWVRFTSGKWVCHECYERSQAVKPGDYCCDQYGRCFIVTENLRARYPFGEHKLPVLHQHEGASETLYQYQAAEINKRVIEYQEFARAIAFQYQARRQAVLTLDEAHDIAITVLLKSASLYRDKPLAPREISNHTKLIEEGFDKVQRTFGNYLTKALYQSLKQRCIRNSIQRKKRGVVIADSEAAYAQAEALAVPEGLPDDLLESWVSYKKKVLEVIGFGDWSLFATWILTNRSQRELGIDHGVTGQAISMRLQKIIRECRQIAASDERWKHLAHRMRLQ